MAQMLLFFEGRTIMCFSQSSLYCCQRRWSGCIDRAMVHSWEIFSELHLKQMEFVVFIREALL